MRFEWTPEGYARVVAQGLGPAEVHEALRGAEPRLLQAVDEQTISVLVRTAAGRLIEVWLGESSDDGVREIFAAFDAGFLGAAKWKNAFGWEDQ
jgi:hypothetical protein